MISNCSIEHKLEAGLNLLIDSLFYFSVVREDEKGGFLILIKPLVNGLCHGPQNLFTVGAQYYFIVELDAKKDSETNLVIWQGHGEHWNEKLIKFFLSSKKDKKNTEYILSCERRDMWCISVSQKIPLACQRDFFMLVDSCLRKEWRFI